VGQLTIERDTWIAAPRERVWAAITEPAHLEKWLLPAYLGAQMKRNDQGNICVCMGPMEIDLVNLKEANEPQRVSGHGLPDGLLTFTYDLKEVNDGTRLTVTMSGFEALTEEAARERLAPSSRAWELALANLKAYIEGADPPHPQGFTTALFGYRRESTEKVSVERSIWIAAPQARVWRAITDPEQIGQWFSPGTQWRGTGLEAGGRFSVYDPETDSEMYTQVIEVVEPPRLFVTRSEPEQTGTPYVTTWTLKEENDGTRLTLTYSGYEAEPEETRYNNMEQTAYGFGMMLTNLAAHIEGRPLPTPGGF
jgi:uncharacterized protein YndB with AHSA1/START domain